MPWMREHGVVGEHADIVVRRENAIEIARKQIMSKSEAFRQKKQVIYASPLVDVAGNMELVRETVEICKVILELTNWDIRLLSKSNLLPKVAQALHNWCRYGGLLPEFNSHHRIIYGVSTGTLDDKLAAAFEQGTAKVSKRIESLHWLQDNGFRTFGMICPSLPQKNYIVFAYEMAKAIRSERCEHIWAECLNARGESFERTHAALERAGYTDEARRFKNVSTDKSAWERYARDTFVAHAHVYSGVTIDGQPKLRFLQYVTKENAHFWEPNVSYGAVIL